METKQAQMNEHEAYLHTKEREGSFLLCPPCEQQWTGVRGEALHVILRPTTCANCERPIGPWDIWSELGMEQ